MNDRFKFRYLFNNEICEVLAFDISDGIEHKCLFLQLKDGTRKIINNYDWSKFMQCTGLKDKNGKLIYEGDICRNTKTDEIVSVAWHGTFASFVWSKPKYAKVYDFGELFRAYDYYEVIGNIYENADLLEEKEL